MIPLITKRRFRLMLGLLIVVAVVGTGIWSTQRETVIWRLDASTLRMRTVELSHREARFTANVGMASVDGTLMVPTTDREIFAVTAYRGGRKVWSTTMLPQPNKSCDAGAAFAWVLAGPDGTALAQANNCTGATRTVGFDVASGKVRWELSDVSGSNVIPAERVVLSEGPNGGFVMLRNEKTSPELIVVNPKTGKIMHQVNVSRPEEDWKIDADDRFAAIVGINGDRPGSQLIAFGSGQPDDEAVVTTIPTLKSHAFDIYRGVLYAATAVDNTNPNRRGYTLTATVLDTQKVAWSNTVLAKPTSFINQNVVVSELGIIMNFRDDRLRVHDPLTGKVMRVIGRANNSSETLGRPVATRRGAIISAAVITEQRTAQFQRYNLTYDAARNEIVFQQRATRWHRILRRPSLSQLGDVAP